MASLLEILNGAVNAGKLFQTTIIILCVQAAKVKAGGKSPDKRSAVWGSRRARNVKIVHETSKNPFRGHFLYSKSVHESIKNIVRGQILFEKVSTKRIFVPLHHDLSQRSYGIT